MTIDKEHDFPGEKPKRTYYQKKRTKNTLINAFGSNASELGRGTYGVVYEIKPTPTALAALRALQQRLKNRLESSMTFGTGKPLVLKTTRPQKGELFSAFVKDNVRETKAHMAVQHAAPYLVPTIYFAGTTESGLFVTLMDLVEGETLSGFYKSHGSIPPQLYQKLHDAIKTLWSLGIVHGDLHDKNVLVTPQGEVKIIDFGFAVMLPSNKRQAIQPYLQSGDLQGAWSVIRPYVDAVQLHRTPSLGWYNPNGKALQVWQTMLSPVSTAPLATSLLLPPKTHSPTSSALEPTPKPGRKRRASNISSNLQVPHRYDLRRRRV